MIILSAKGYVKDRSLMISAEYQVLYEILGEVGSCLGLKGNLIGYITTLSMGGCGAQRIAE